MENAPIGSCYNDPTLPKCPPADRVASPSADGPYGLTAVATSARHHRRHRAHAALDNQCWVRASDLTKSTGHARAYGANQCTDRVFWQELYVDLDEYWVSDGKWHRMNVGSDEGPGGITIRAQTSYPCTDSKQRHWRNISEGYADLDGVWYADHQTLDDYLYCRG